MLIKYTHQLTNRLFGHSIIQSTHQSINLKNTYILYNDIQIVTCIEVIIEKF